MNITTENYLSSLERFVRDLPRLIAQWDQIDETLQDEYISQIEWLLKAQAEAIREAPAHQALDVRQRIAIANKSLYQMSHLLQVIGLNLDELLKS